MNISNGMTVRDRITGWTGVVVGIVDYISGCKQALVLPPHKNGNEKSPEGTWYDLQRLEQLPGTAIIILDNALTPGCDIAPPQR